MYLPLTPTPAYRDTGANDRKCNDLPRCVAVPDRVGKGQWEKRGQGGTVPMAHLAENGIQGFPTFTDVNWKFTAML